jgi:uncharacterized lipoprotein YmbA
MMRLVAGVAILCALAGSAGCSSSPSRFYTLSANAAPNSATSNLSIAVGSVSIPAAVDRPQIVVNTGANQVSIEDFNRWAAPLQDNIQRVVAENLVALLGAPRVTLFPPALNADVDYRVQIEIRNFESVLGKTASLDAIWTVRRTRDGKIETGRTSVREPIQEGTFDALAAAHSRGVAKLSQDIADAVRALARGTG